MPCLPRSSSSASCCICPPDSLASPLRLLANRQKPAPSPAPAPPPTQLPPSNRSRLLPARTGIDITAAPCRVGAPDRHLALPQPSARPLPDLLGVTPSHRARIAPRRSRPRAR
jgi:hypothetical protein